MPSTHKFKKGNHGNNEGTKRNDDDNDDDNTIMTRKEHGLKFKDADLKIIVGVEDDNEVGMEDEDGDEKQTKATVKKNKNTKASEKKEKVKVYCYIKEILASKSNYIETLLSMPFESASKTTITDVSNQQQLKTEITTITFPDLTPTEWEDMMKFIFDPVAIRSMDEKTAERMCIFYDKYEFQTGIQLCDVVLSKYIHDHDFKVFCHHETIDWFIDIIVMSYEKCLHKTTIAGMRQLFHLLDCVGTQATTILTASHIRKIVPVIDHFLNSDQKFSDSLRLKNHLKDGLKDLFRLTSDDDTNNTEMVDVLNPMFPQLFVAHFKLNASYLESSEIISRIVITKEFGTLRGTYILVNPGNGILNYIRDEDEDEEIPIVIDDDGGYIEYQFIRDGKSNGDWIIQSKKWSSNKKDVFETLFVCKGSRNKVFPPPHGWTRCNETSRTRIPNNPKLKYYHDRENGKRVQIKLGTDNKWHI
mmetsp:Transcript_6610/g.7682  ORF Transcript_6610/g.7682 Transcript_6610/m.7682 type:complete len:473 (-) Transcript_6610:113-1531(-)